ncbi:hypothetical protein Poli38472_000223 [Pythium oligandrum]|uniref:Homeobox domain-containing protein n=1 Tax=Pythium oligandrum TaxID=41045 RepID=A0A8K1FF54_PYTOL|nr:hypothetical protein Poli38472_000223 [Pythium oligandrum]|eukprot:TMW60181.1 hypothetical protein Poli38472_000223 [Pythium oligandrum]
MASAPAIPMHHHEAVDETEEDEFFEDDETMDEGDDDDDYEEEDDTQESDKRLAELVQHHELCPLVEKIRLLISTPSQLLVALLPPPESPFTVQEPSVLVMKARSYQYKHLRALQSRWQRAMDGIKQRQEQATDLDEKELLHQVQVDELMMKTVLFYWRLWRYLTVILIGIVHYVESTIIQTAQDCIPHLSPCMSPPYETKAIDSGSNVLPIRRLRSSSSITSSTDSSSDPLLPSRASSTRRNRLARPSNEFMIAWFLAHKSNPYPSAAERLQIAEKTGLSEQQVRNWFANMRKRHWKPKENSSKKPRCLLDMLLRQDEDV